MEFHISLVGRKDLTGEIYRQLRRAILDGRLPPGGRLPASRELAAQLSVSRTTVVVAYDRLIGEGFVTGRVGAGTFVSDDLPGAGHRSGATGGMLRPRPIRDGVDPLVIERAAEFDFRPGIPDARLFPYQSWRRLLAREFSPAAVGAGHYADPAGHAGLREAIAGHIGVSRGVQASAEDVVVTNGTQQAVDVVARVLLAPGDRVAVEDPCYRPPRRLLQTLGAKVTGVPVDDQGMIVDAIPSDARLVYVHPLAPVPTWDVDVAAAAHGPAGLGRAPPGGHPGGRLRQRVPLRRPPHRTAPDPGPGRPGRLCRLVLQDTAGHPAPGVRGGAGVAASGRPGGQAADRLAHAPAPPGGAGPLHPAGVVRPPSPQDAGHLPGPPRAGRRDPDRAVRRPPEADPSAVGLHLTATAPGTSSEDLDGLLRRASAAGVELLPLSLYGVDTPPQPGLIFAYGAIPTSRIGEGLDRLRRCFD